MQKYGRVQILRNDSKKSGGWLGHGTGPDAVAKRKYPVPAPVGNRTPVFRPVVYSLHCAIR